MFYGPSSSMAPPSKSRLKRQSRLFSQVLYRTLSYKDRGSASASPAAAEDDPAELSTQLSAPGILKIFGGNICAGTNYKSVLVTDSSGARELVKEALERYGLSQLSAAQYALCDVIGRFQGPENQWQTEGLRVLGDHEKPLLIQDLWKPREGFSRRLELRRRAEVEEMAAKDVDTTTAGQGAEAERHRARGARRGGGPERGRALPALRRHAQRTSLGPRLEGPAAARSSGGSRGMRYSLYQSPHLLLLQGYSQQHLGLPAEPRAAHGGPEDAGEQAQHQPVSPRHPAPALHHQEAAPFPAPLRGEAGAGAHRRRRHLCQLRRGGPDGGAAARGPAVPRSLLPAPLQGPHEGAAAAGADPAEAASPAPRGSPRV
uniref:Ras-associating domain-containing protein n=1 Tax=Malurus cyaneus samueli TaxID=2593467 RepID=A0A8C5UEL7_9PASS